MMQSGGERDEKDKRDWSHASGGSSVVRSAYIASSIPRQGLSLSVDKAQARIGRPLTPGSIAGVHRRHERRSYRRGYYYGGGYYPYRYHGGYYRYRYGGHY